MKLQKPMTYFISNYLNTNEKRLQQNNDRSFNSHHAGIIDSSHDLPKTRTLKGNVNSQSQREVAEELKNFTAEMFSEQFGD